MNRRNRRFRRGVRPRTPNRGTVVGVVLVLAAAVASAVQNDGPPAPSDQPTAVPTATPDVRYRPRSTATPRSRIAAARAMDGYDRDEFGPRWADVDHNGCGTRDDILARDLDDVQRRGRCIVIAGVLTADPYTGALITFAKADAAAVQIDHVVPLAEAWRSGASTWTPERRLQFANDPRNLLAVDGPTNAAKSDRTPATWLPTDRSRACRYVRAYAAVKRAWRLTFTPVEWRSIRATTTAACSEQGRNR
ncbi:MAG: HNH endonuclease family protein [Phycicoccus sp.]